MTITVNQVISFSGGKDSTALLLLMLEKGISVHSAVAFDGGWEFPDMLGHWAEVEKKTGIKVTILRHEHDFDYWMYDHPVRKRISGSKYGDVYRVGNGWPSSSRRWCTSIKKNVIRKYLQKCKPYILNIGIALDEQKRARPNNQVSYPLIEWGITEERALEICRSYGFTWHGLYDVFPRSSCYCCPLQPLSSLRLLMCYYPYLWEEMLRKEKNLPEDKRVFVRQHSAHDLEIRFRIEQQGSLF